MSTFAAGAARGCGDAEEASLEECAQRLPPSQSSERAASRLRACLRLGLADRCRAGDPARLLPERRMGGASRCRTGVSKRPSGHESKLSRTPSDRESRRVNPRSARGTMIALKARPTSQRDQDSGQDRRGDQRRLRNREDAQRATGHAGKSAYGTSSDERPERRWAAANGAGADQAPHGSGQKPAQKGHSQRSGPLPPLASSEILAVGLGPRGDRKSARARFRGRASLSKQAYGACMPPPGLDAASARDLLRAELPGDRFGLNYVYRPYRSATGEMATLRRASAASEKHRPGDVLQTGATDPRSLAGNRTCASAPGTSASA